MSVVASACALNHGLDLVLRQRGLVTTRKLLTLDQIITKIRNYVSKNPSSVMAQIQLDNYDKVRHYRNAFVHPEGFLILTPSFRKNVFTLKPKRDTPKDKEEAYIASQYDKKTKLKTMAEESLNIAYNTIRESLENLRFP